MPNPLPLTIAPDPLLLTIAYGIVHNIVLPEEFKDSRHKIVSLFARCLARATESVSIEVSTTDIVRADLTLLLVHYNDYKQDVVNNLEDVLDAVGVETEETPGCDASLVHLNRFSGLDVDE